MFGRTPLHLACRAGNFTAVCFLLRKGTDQVDENGETRMAEQPLDTNSRSIGGVTPLMRAAEFGDINIAIQLLQAAVDPS